MSFFVGLDWGSESHAVCVVDEAGKIVDQFEVSHDAKGLRSLRERLLKRGAASELPIAIERPSGLVVDTLVDTGHPIIPIHPNIAKASRSRYRAAGGKNDRGDSYLLADVLRTDGHRFRRLLPQSDDIKALRAKVRTRTDFVMTRVALGNQLRAILGGFWPGVIGLFAEIDSKISLAFLTRFPTPQSAAKLTEKSLGTFLSKRRYSGGKTPAELLGRLRAAAPSVSSELESKANGELVLSLVRILESIVEEIGQVDKSIADQMNQLADGALVMSLPRTGVINAAQILSEIGDVRERFLSEDQLAAEAGVAPVTYESGKSRGVRFRRACNHKLRFAITTWADNSRHVSPWAKDIYERARARGCRHPHAIRVLARAWIRVLWRVWTSREHYDPARHSGSLRFLASVQATG